MFEFVTGKKQKIIIKNEFYKENLMDNTTLTIAQKKTKLLKTRNPYNAVLQESLDSLFKTTTLL